MIILRCLIPNQLLLSAPKKTNSVSNADCYWLRLFKNKFNDFLVLSDEA